VEHRDSFRLALVQEANAVDIHKTHLRQIQNDGGPALVSSAFT